MELTLLGILFDLPFGDHYHQSLTTQPNLTLDQALEGSVRPRCALQTSITCFYRLLYHILFSVLLCVFCRRHVLLYARDTPLTPEETVISAPLLLLSHFNVLSTSFKLFPTPLVIPVTWYRFQQTAFYLASTSKSAPPCIYGQSHCHSRDLPPYVAPSTHPTVCGSSDLPQAFHTSRTSGNQPLFINCILAVPNCYCSSYKRVLYFYLCCS